MNKIDGSYRLLFSNSQLVRDLFRGIVDEPWLSLVDWSTLEPLPSDYVSAVLRQRQGDHVWRVQRRDGEHLFMLLMLEYQSSNDRYMALRNASYCSLLYESILAHGLIGKGMRLPLVLPVVIYSGIERWRAPVSTVDLIDDAPDELARFRMQMDYLLVDEGALVRSGKLPHDNLATLLFRLEHNKGVADVQDLLQTIWNRTQGEEYASLRLAFATWTKYVLLPRALPDAAIPAVDDLLEIKDMLTDYSRSWTDQWKAEAQQEGWQQGLQEGRQEGRQQGLQEGRREGTRDLFQRLLQQKFGHFPEEVERRLDGATPEQIEKWTLRLLDAADLDDVFVE